MSTLTIGFVPRERFSLAAEALRRIYDCTDPPFNLIVVDCNIPSVYRKEMDQVLQDRSNVEIIHTDHYLRPNQAKNLVIKACQDEFLCLIENDVLVERNWVTHLMKACDEMRADVAVPAIYERVGETCKIHGLGQIGQFEFEHGSDGPRMKVAGLSRDQFKASANCARIESLETHCMLFRRNVFDRIGLLDEEMTTRDNLDLGLALYHAKVPVVLEPQSQVNFIPPPPIFPDERDYYLMRWNPDTAEKIHRHICDKWKLASIPGSQQFVEERIHLVDNADPDAQLQSLAEKSDNRLMTQKLAKAIQEKTPADATIIVVDGGNWNLRELANGRAVFPFIEHEGQYWGCPADDETAIRELERLRSAGATHICFCCPALWWLDHYEALRRYLATQFTCVRADDLVVVYELCAQPEASSRA